MRTTEKTYTIEGMTCGHCELSVRKEVEALAGVASAQADFASGTLIVRGEWIDDQAVRHAVGDAGYQVAGPLPVEPSTLTAGRSLR